MPVAVWSYSTFCLECGAPGIAVVWLLGGGVWGAQASREVSGVTTAGSALVIV